MGQYQEQSPDTRAKDATGSPHNLNDQKSRNHAKFGDRKDVNPLISGKGIGGKRAGPTK